MQNSCPRRQRAITGIADFTSFAGVIAVIVTFFSHRLNMFFLYSLVHHMLHVANMLLICTFFHSKLPLYIRIQTIKRIAQEALTCQYPNVQMIDNTGDMTYHYDIMV